VPDRTIPHYAPHYGIVRSLMRFGSSAPHFRITHFVTMCLWG